MKLISMQLIAMQLIAMELIATKLIAIKLIAMKLIAMKLIAMKLISISIRNVVNQSFSHGARLSGVLLLSVEISDKPNEDGTLARLDFWLFSALSFRAILLFG